MKFLGYASDFGLGELPDLSPPPEAGGIATPPAPARPTRFDAPYWNDLANSVEREYGLPAGLLNAVKNYGERTNADQIGGAGERSPFQILPATRERFLQKFGVDAYANDESAARVAALHLKDSLDRHGDVRRAVREYNGSGPAAERYADRVMTSYSPPSGLTRRPDEGETQVQTQAQGLPARATARPKREFLGYASDLGLDIEHPYLPRQPAAPAPPQQGVIGTGIGYAKELAQSVYDAFIYHLPASIAATVEDSDPFSADNFLDALIRRGQARQAERAKQPGDAVTQELRNFAPNLAFSLVSMGLGLVGGIGAAIGTAATGVGAPAAPAAGVAAGMAASGTAAYRMDRNQAARELRRSVEEARGGPISDEEWKGLLEQYENELHKHGLYEAIPEAAGQALGFGIINSAARVFGKGAITRFASKAGAFLAGELGGETVTRIGQHNQEVRMGMRPGERERSFDDPLDWYESAKEVAPQVLLLGGVMAGAAKVGSAGYRALRGPAAEEPEAQPDATPAPEAGESTQTPPFLPRRGEVPIQAGPPGPPPPGGPTEAERRATQLYAERDAEEERRAVAMGEKFPEIEGLDALPPSPAGRPARPAPLPRIDKRLIDRQEAARAVDAALRRDIEDALLRAGEPRLEPEPVATAPVQTPPSGAPAGVPAATAPAAELPAIGSRVAWTVDGQEAVGVVERATKEGRSAIINVERHPRIGRGRQAIVAFDALQPAPAAAGTPPPEGNAGMATPAARPEPGRRTAAQYRAERARVKDTDSLLDAIRKLGGVQKDALVGEWGVDPKDLARLVRDNPGLPVHRVNGGRSLDGMAEVLHELGYLEARDLREFEAKFADELRGRKHYTPAGHEAILAASRAAPSEQAARPGMQPETLEAAYGEPDELTITQDELDATDYNGLTEAEREIALDISDRIDRLRARFEKGSPARMAVEEIIESADEATRGQSIRALWGEIVRQLRERLHRETEHPGTTTERGTDLESGGAASGAPPPEAGSRAAALAQPAESVQPTASGETEVAASEERPLLETPTPEALRARAETERRAAEEKAQRENAPPPSEFALTGSDRPADLAAARGQVGLFERAEPAPPAQPAPAAPPARRTRQPKADGIAKNKEQQAAPPLSEIMVKMEAIEEETGRKVRVLMPADKALKANDEQIEKVKALLECLRS